VPNTTINGLDVDQISGTIDAVTRRRQGNSLGGTSGLSTHNAPPGLTL